MDLTSRLVSRYVENSNCFVAILSDGITSNDFVITKSDGLFLPTSLNAQNKKRYPSLGKTFSIAKNLDYYQNKICQLVPFFSDSSNTKIDLQKVRVIVIAMLLKLVEIIHTHISESRLQEWNLHADSVLISVSEIVLHSNHDNSSDKVITEIRASTLLYLEINNTNLEKQISNLYGR